MSSPFNLSGHSTSQKTIERECEDALFTGKINLGGRKLKEIPKVLHDYDLSDTTDLDLSKNRFSEIPTEICEFLSLEYLNCYHNVIKIIPTQIQHLEALVHLDLSRNHLTSLPAAVCQIQTLEVLLVSNNKLLSLPDEIQYLESLTQLDASCNQLTYIPETICELESLRYLNLRKNQLMELSSGICCLKLRKLDVSRNKISTIPFEFQAMDTIEELLLGENPLVCPPAQVCIQGYVHVMKYLHCEALKEDRRKGIFSEQDLRKQHKNNWHSQDQKSNIFNQCQGQEFQDCEFGESRYSHRCSDSGYSTNVDHIISPNATSSRNDGLDASYKLASFRSQEFPNDSKTSQESSQDTLRTSNMAATIPFGQVLEPPTTNESHSQRISNKRNDSEGGSLWPQTELLERDIRFREPVLIPIQHSTHAPTKDQDRSHHVMKDIMCTEPFQKPVIPRPENILAKPVMHDGTSPAMGEMIEDEFRLRHESMIAVQRREAHLVRGRLHEEKEKIRQFQKDAVLDFIKRSHETRLRDDVAYPDMSSSNYHYEYDSSEKSSYTDSPQNRLPYRCQIALESMSGELSSANPVFTIRRNIHQASEEIELIHALRQNIENRLKITLPDDLSAALKDGVVLCHLANHIRPRSVSSIHVPSPAVPKLTAAKCRKNVENFLEACLRIGVSQEMVCPASAIQEANGITLVANTVGYLLQCVQPSQFSSV